MTCTANNTLHGRAPSEVNVFKTTSNFFWLCGISMMQNQFTANEVNFQRIRSFLVAHFTFFSTWSWFLQCEPKIIKFLAWNKENKEKTALANSIYKISLRSLCLMNVCLLSYSFAGTQSVAYPFHHSTTGKNDATLDKMQIKMFVNSSIQSNSSHPTGRKCCQRALHLREEKMRHS